MLILYPFCSARQLFTILSPPKSFPDSVSLPSCSIHNIHAFQHSSALCKPLMLFPPQISFWWGECHVKQHMSQRLLSSIVNGHRPQLSPICHQSWPNSLSGFSALSIRNVYNGHRPQLSPICHQSWPVKPADIKAPNSKSHLSIICRCCTISALFKALRAVHCVWYLLVN